MLSLLKTYLKRLTNLSSRNKSLLLSRLSAEQFLDLHDLDFLLSKSSFEILNQLIQRKTRIALCDAQDPRFEKVNDISKKFRRIARTERFIEEERGSRDLYVGYPFVRGKFADGSVVHAPLLFFPVTLRLDREQWCLFERDDAEISLNRSFALAYGQFNEAKVPDEILEKNFGDASKDAMEFRTDLYEWLKDSPFRLNFNQRLFENTLQPFEALKSSELQNLENNGELKLYPELVLGIFPQAGSYLVPDYNFLLQEAERPDFSLPLLQPEKEGSEDFESANDLPKNQPLREEQILTPLPVDWSQESVIRLVKEGESVVVQGPPGTGKSQLICNLMADFAARGKRVLLVCQKRAALDVVHGRLQTLGLGPFAALIHDFRNDRAELYRQIAIQIEKVEEYQSLNRSLDAVFLDREFTKNSRLIDQTVQELEEFRTALFDETESGLSVKELYLTSDPEGLRVDLRAHYRALTLNETDDFRRRLNSYATYNRKIDDQHAWHERKSFAGYGLGDLRRIEESLADWPLFVQKQKAQFELTTGRAFSLDFIHDKTESKERLGDLLTWLADASTFQIFQRYLTDQQPVIGRLAFIRQVTDTLEGWRADGGEVESTLAKTELADFRPKLANAISAKASAMKGQWWEWFGKEKAVVMKTVQANGLSTRLEDLQRLALRLRNRLELEQWLESPLLNFQATDLNAALPFGESHLLFFQQAERAADALQRIRPEPWEEVLTELALKAATATDFRSLVAATARLAGQVAAAGRCLYEIFDRKSVGKTAAEI